MPIYLLLRIASILVVAALAGLSPDRPTWLSLVYSITLAHFLLAFVYSRRQIADALTQPLSLLAILSVALVGGTLYAFRISLVFYFALHHAFNEAYVLKHTTPGDDAAVRAFRGSGVLLHLFLYLFLLRRTASMGPSDLSFLYPLFRRTGGLLNENLLLAGLAVSYGLFFYYLFRIRRHCSRRVLIENCGLEVLGLGAAAVSFVLPFQFLHIVLYHVVFWSLLPLPKLVARGARGLLPYLGLTAAAVAGFVALSPIGVPGLRLRPALFQQQFILWSYIHITASLVLSNAHPQWLVDLFRPRRPGPETGRPAVQPLGASPAGAGPPR